VHPVLEILPGTVLIFLSSPQTALQVSSNHHKIPAFSPSATIQDASCHRKREENPGNTGIEIPAYREVGAGGTESFSASWIGISLDTRATSPPLPRSV
jgi:hypothetical protein